MVNKVTKIYFKLAKSGHLKAFQTVKFQNFLPGKSFSLVELRESLEFFKKCVSTLIEASVVWTLIVDPNSVLWIEITQPTQLLVH